MASNADVTNISARWKEQLQSLIIPDFSDAGTAKEELGSGMYGETSVVSHNSVSYSTKKIHIGIASKDEFRANFAEDCLVMSQLRHPHLAQFLGVQIGDSFTPPVLVSELYPLSLATCLQRYPEVPERSKYSILLETTVGIEYLHRQSPSVIHGHLNPSNILLTEGLHVKIADCMRFGLNISPPTNSPYQAPEETLVEASDVFSIGDVMLLIALQREPSPLEYKHHRNPENKNEPVILSEMKRRESFLEEVSESHKLKELIVRCLEEEPTKRPSTGELTEALEKIVKEDKPEYGNILEMFVALGQLSLMKDSVASLEETVKAKEEEIEALKEQMEPMRGVIGSKDEALAAMKEEIEGYKQALQSKEGRIKAHESGVRAKEALIKAKDREIAAKKQVIAAKEAHLKSASKRIAVLEQHVKSSPSKKTSTSAPTTTASSFLPSPSHSNNNDAKFFSDRSLQSSPDSISGRTSREAGSSSTTSSTTATFLPYRGTSAPMHAPRRGDSLPRSATLKSTPSETDPKLAKILARQHQKIDDDKDCIHEKESGSTQKPPLLRKRSKTVDVPESKELRKILEKRKSFVEET